MENIDKRKEKKYFVDYGNDWNNDKHCDIEGWFVNGNGNHRARSQEVSNKVEAKITAHTFGVLEIMDYFDIHSGTLEDSIKAAFTNYSYDDKGKRFGADEINNYCRFYRECDRELEDRISILSKTINETRIKKDLKVYRAISLKAPSFTKKVVNLKVGDVFSDAGFMSTSFSPFSAMEYVKKFNCPYSIFEISVKSGTNCYPLDRVFFSTKKEEHEILFDRNTKLLVKDKYITKDNNNKFVVVYRMEIIQ